MHRRDFRFACRFTLRAACGQPYASCLAGLTGHCLCASYLLSHVGTARVNCSHEVIARNALHYKCSGQAFAHVHTVAVYTPTRLPPGVMPTMRCGYTGCASLSIGLQ
jgi:hypothetical protein